AAATEVESLRAALAEAEAAATTAQDEARRAQAEGERLEAAANAARAEAEQLQAAFDAVSAGTQSELEGVIARTTAWLQDARRHAQDADEWRWASAACR